MEWWMSLLLILGGLLILMGSGFPVAFCFLLVNFVASFLFWGISGPDQFLLSIRDSVVSFSFLPVPLFILMGTVMFHSGLAPFIIEAVDRWLGRMPGRLSLLAVGGGTILSALSGASMASVAILGSALVPEMEKRGYQKPMTLGPILGSGGLAIMIPPSGLAVLLGAIGEISIGQILIAIIVPGLVMAVLYAGYIVIRCMLQPHIAPAYSFPPIPIMQKIIPTVRYVLPQGVIIFLVVGVILFGIATPTEAAATGALGMFALSAVYGRLNWPVIKKAIGEGASTSVMVMMIMLGARGFSEVLAFSEASSGLVEFGMSLPVPPIMMIVFMQVIVLIMGMFMSPGAVLMVSLPLFMPIVRSQGFNEVWFAVITLLNIEMGMTTPPFGMNLFVMRGSAPPGTTMGDIYRAGLPFLYCDAIAMILLLIFPALALWLPGLMS